MCPPNIEHQSATGFGLELPAQEASGADRRAQACDERAAAVWTAERTRGLFGGKNLLFPPAQYGSLLRTMGLLKRDGSMAPESVHKYLQISHMATILEVSLRELASKHPVVRVLDLACGNSYLTLMMAALFDKRIGHPAQVLGVDRNDRLVHACSARAKRLGLQHMLRFRAGRIDDIDVHSVWSETFPGPADGPLAHVLVALHACDTATDDAIAIGLSLGSEVIAVAPCCQAELAQAWTALAESNPDHAFGSIWREPHLRRETAATMTNTLRLLLLRGCGYWTTALEFVPTEHTPKNTLIRAVRRGSGSPEAFLAYLALREAVGGVRLRLEAVLPAPHAANLAAAEGARPEAVSPR